MLSFIPSISRRTLRIWEISAAIALLVSLVIFLLELTTQLTHNMPFIIKGIESSVVAIFLGEVGAQLLYTDDKRAFLKKNWIYILTIIPIAGMMRLLRLGRLAEVARLTRLIDCTKYLKSNSGLGVLALMSPGQLMFGKRASSMIYHLYRTDFSVLRPQYSQVMDCYISPHASQACAVGIREGIRGFMKERTGISVRFRHRDWYPMFTIEQQLLRNDQLHLDNYHTYLKSSRPSLVITDELLPGELQTHNMRTDKENPRNLQAVFSTRSSDHTTYSHLPTRERRYYHGFIRGYNAAARHIEPCYFKETHCAHAPMQLDEIDRLSFLMYTTRELRRCRYHENPSDKKP